MSMNKSCLLSLFLCVVMAMSLTMTTFPVLGAESTADTGLYRSQLNKNDQKIYDSMKQQVKKGRTNFSIEIPGSSDLMSVLFVMKVVAKDNPELLMAGNNALAIWSAYRSENGKTINPEFGTVPSSRSKVTKAVSQVDSILMNMKATTVYGQVKYFHDWLTENVSYSGQGAYAHTAIGALVYKKGVCESYTKAFKILCDRMDIPCVIVTGSNHAWNYVKMPNGSWYMVDCTFDDPIGGKPGYRYFLASNNPNIKGNQEDKGSIRIPATSKTSYKGSVQTAVYRAPGLVRGNKCIKAEWAKVHGAEYYNVYRKAAGESTYRKIGKATGRKYTDKNIKAGVRYSYKVRAVMKVGSKTKYFDYTKSASIKA